MSRSEGQKELMKDGGEDWEARERREERGGRRREGGRDKKGGKRRKEEGDEGVQGIHTD